MDDLVHYFREIPSWEGYYIVSTSGIVASLRHRFGERNTPRICRSHESTRGYLRVRLCRNNKVTFVSIHRAVVLAFVGDIPSDKCVRHLDGNKKNNHLNNLKIGTAKENANDEVIAKRHPHGITHPRAKISDKNVIEIRKLYREGKSQKEIAKIFKVGQAHISKIIRKNLWKHI